MSQLSLILEINQQGNNINLYVLTTLGKFKIFCNKTKEKYNLYNFGATLSSSKTIRSINLKQEHVFSLLKL